MSSSKIEAVIIDDEENSRDSLKGKLDLFCPEIEVVAEADNVDAGYSAILEHEPDVVFLDVKLGSQKGFDVLDKLEKESTGYQSFNIIFITAHDEFAIQAIKFSALDYLLKPIDSEELVKAIRKIETSTKDKSGSPNFDVLLENIRQVTEAPKKIVVPTSDGIHVIKISEILRCESSSNYTKFFLSNERHLLASKTLKEFDMLLSRYQFERIHKSHLVNMNYLKRYVQTDGGYIIMEDGSRIPVANRKKEHLLSILKAL